MFYNDIIIILFPYQNLFSLIFNRKTVQHEKNNNIRTSLRDKILKKEDPCLTVFPKVLI